MDVPPPRPPGSSAGAVPRLSPDVQSLASGLTAVGVALPEPRSGEKKARTVPAGAVAGANVVPLVMDDQNRLYSASILTSPGDLVRAFQQSPEHAPLLQQLRLSGLQVRQTPFARPAPKTQWPSPNGHDGPPATSGGFNAGGWRGHQKEGRDCRSSLEDPQALSDKVEKRLVQNREAARRCRQRKQEYLRKLEQEVEALRRKLNARGAQAATGANGKSQPASASDQIAGDRADFIRWRNEELKLVHCIRDLMQDGDDGKLQEVVDTLFNQQIRMCNDRRRLIASGRWHLLASGTELNPAQRLLLWLGGVRPSLTFKTTIHMLAAVKGAMGSHDMLFLRQLLEKIIEKEKELQGRHNDERDKLGLELGWPLKGAADRPAQHDEPTSAGQRDSINSVEEDLHSAGGDEPGSPEAAEDNSMEEASAPCRESASVGNSDQGAASPSHMSCSGEASNGNGSKPTVQPAIPESLAHLGSNLGWQGVGWGQQAVVQGRGPAKGEDEGNRRRREQLARKFQGIIDVLADAETFRSDLLTQSRLNLSLRTFAMLLIAPAELAERTNNLVELAVRSIMPLEALQSPSCPRFGSFSSVTTRPRSETPASPCSLPFDPPRCRSGFF
ncbi:unnamed protein product [Ostreobium quekettii]|uniref:BZIP domain-containing protein n=1 Tax=Ostreobium quekettii TaxID=121088 RepID=A0A8S1JDZ1_9CHLO|nr:unnamed protein product [Ostreobium quekettii]